MNTKKLLTNAAFLLVVLANVGCDQISKRIVREEVSSYVTISLIKHHFVLTKVENTGAFLSVGSALPDFLKFFLLSIIPLLALSYGIVYLVTKPNLTKISALSLSFAIGGGIGNIYDRIIHGSVTDFMHIDLGIVQTGIFNMADVSITFGMILFFVQSYFVKKKVVKG
ncbi:signal peptidase II [Dyadobacter psychrotolerans]|uniref:Lipoprotein signal peptidase n=1 Tax=Dyadobacter psychrotolerans TaxID=2541721 RepID=A0A4R5DT37_9BACT|nr:signal peptidase II [Dyadobacter psychrotolerans]TDE17549.1 signal peptidase II [Dyadobacter psychrotolerans]